MTIGDGDNIAGRLRSLIPSNWFGAVAPVRDAVLGGLADALAWQYTQSMVAKAQSRLATASGWFLDLAAYDFFGLRIRRPAGQLDAPFRDRIRKEVLRERVTRLGMIQALTDLTGNAPVIFEPWNTGDAGAYGRGRLAYGRAGGWGNMNLSSQAFITVRRGGGAGVPKLGGYGSSVGGYGAGRIAYISPADEQVGITDADIYQTVQDTKPTGSVMWVAII